ncbi:MAG: exodeoxyribonuclease VII small subunit [Anaerolineaceae bacterium]|nr:exodeoxyribonuclease VII small subunit [Anaerolineaceae bacterium]
MSENASLENMTFEEAYSQLESVITALEGGEVPLDEAVNLYEQGRKLSARCQSLLDDAELRISRLNDDGSTTSLT